MKPVLIVSGDFVLMGGMDAANHALAAYLADVGHQVHLVGHSISEDLRSHENVRFHPVPKPLDSYLIGAPLLDRTGRYWARRLARVGGRTIVNGGNCVWGDANWVHFVHAAHRPQTRGGAARRLRSGIAHSRARRREVDAIGRARVVIANSERTRRELIELLRVNPADVKVIYYGTDAERYAPTGAGDRAALRSELGLPSGRPLVAFIGALGDRRKGFDVLHAAWTRLCEDPAWDADLVVVGGGAELQAWRQRSAADARLARRVHYLGRRGDVPAILSVCDSMVAPTRYEAYGLAVHEAICAGLPSLVAGSAGVAEVYPPELRDLLLADVEDVDAIAASLRAWRANMESCRERARPLADRLSRRSWQQMASELAGAVGLAA